MAAQQKRRTSIALLLASAPFFSSALCCALACVVSRDARADDAAAASSRPQLTFAWSAPEGCEGERDVRARVDRILGTHATPHENVDAKVRVVTEGGTYRAEIELNSAGSSSSRRVDDASCSALADAVALIVALAVDPEAAAPKTDPTPPPPPAKPEPPKPTPPVSGKIADAAPEHVTRRPFYFGASVLLDTATLASLAGGAELVAGYNPPHMALELSGTWLAGQDAHLSSVPTEGASEHALGIGARACWEIIDSAFTLGPCGGAELTGIFADGFGSTTPSEASAGLVRALLGGRAKLQFSRFALRLAAEAAIPFTRPSFVIDNGGLVQKISPASFRTTFGAEIHF
ncbi:MAG: hypothetical protein ABI461_08100 [Polyangiaceae bacterium]